MAGLRGEGGEGVADLCGDVEGAIRDMEVSDDKYQEGHGDEITDGGTFRRTRVLVGGHKGAGSRCSAR